MFFKIGAAITILLLAILYPNVSKTVHNFGVFEATKHLKNNCYFEGLGVHCSDGQMIDGAAYFTCHGSNPGLFVYDKTGLVHLQDIANPRGLGITTDPQDKTKLFIAVVNDTPSGSTVEQFIMTKNSKSVEHVNSVPVGTFLYDVIPVSRDSFYATNSFQSKNKWFEELARRSTGSVLFFEDGQVRTVAKDITFPTGITIKNDKVYVVSKTNRQLYVYERKDDDGLKLLDVVDVGVLGESVSTNKDAVYIAGHQHYLQFLKGLKEKQKSASVVVKITPNKSQDQFYGKKYKTEVVIADDGSNLSGGSVALVGAKTIIAGFFTDGLLVCPTKL